jgi:RNA-dependent RNA polymerase
MFFVGLAYNIYLQCSNDFGNGREGYPVMKAIHNPWEWGQDCIEVDNIVPGRASQANHMLMQYGEGCIEADNTVPGMAT